MTVLIDPDLFIDTDHMLLKLVMPAMHCGVAEQWMICSLVGAVVVLIFHEASSEQQRSRWAKQICSKCAEALEKWCKPRKGDAAVQKPSNDETRARRRDKVALVAAQFMKLAMVVGSVMCLIVAAKFKGHITTDTKV